MEPYLRRLSPARVWLNYAGWLNYAHRQLTIGYGKISTLGWLQEAPGHLRIIDT